ARERRVRGDAARDGGAQRDRLRGDALIRLAVAAVVLAAVSVAHAGCPTDDATQTAMAAARAEAALRCDCAGTGSRRAVVACVADVVGGSALPHACRSAVVRCASASICGAPGTVTCCRTQGAVTRCRHGLAAASCTARGGVPCVEPFPACCATPTTST